jgi:5-methylcytosine-specific restriction enzyme subunit McrC
VNTGGTRFTSCPEYGEIPYEVLGDATVQQLESTVNQLNVPLFRFFRRHLQARQYVGTVQVAGHTIQVLPKIYSSERENLAYLLALLAYTRQLKLRQTGLSQFDTLNGSLLEIWIGYFARELDHLLRHHRRTEYLEIEEETGFLRGKLLIEKMRYGRETLTGQYPCRYEVFSADHLMNRVLKYCNQLLLVQTTVPATAAILRENSFLLGDVSEEPVTAGDLDRIHLNRLNQRYQPALDFCRLLLTHSTLDLRAGRITQLAFMFDMNRLFEEFVAEFLTRHKMDIDLGGGHRLVSVDSQRNLGSLFGEFRMNVDLVLVDSSGKTVLVDTKYKSLNQARKHQSLSQEDFYQMYAYGRAGKKEYDEIILLYPETDRIARTFSSGKLRLHIRQFNPRCLFDLHDGRVNTAAAVAELSRALCIHRER